MTKIFLGVALVILGAIPIIADDSVARWVLGKVQASEAAQGAGTDAFDRVKADSLQAPGPFLDKFQTSLKERYWDLRYAFMMGNYPLCKDLTQATLDLYKDSALASDPLYPEFLFYRGRAWEESGEYKFVNAKLSYAQFVDQYSSSPLAPEAKKRLADLELLTR
jgi:hypothetical protein